VVRDHREPNVHVFTQNVQRAPVRTRPGEVQSSCSAGKAQAALGAHTQRRTSTDIVAGGRGTVRRRCTVRAQPCALAPECPGAIHNPVRRTRAFAPLIPPHRVSVPTSPTPSRMPRSSHPAPARLPTRSSHAPLTCPLRQPSRPRPASRRRSTLGRRARLANHSPRMSLNPSGPMPPSGRAAMGLGWGARVMAQSSANHRVPIVPSSATHRRLIGDSSATHRPRASSVGRGGYFWLSDCMRKSLAKLWPENWLICWQ